MDATRVKEALHLSRLETMATRQLEIGICVKLAQDEQY